MPTAEVHIETERASRYLVQLCRHADQMRRHLHQRLRAHGGGAEPPEVRHVEWTDTDGTVRLPWGQWTLRATATTLTLRAEAADEDKLLRIQELLTKRLETMGRRDRLKVTWQRSEATGTPGSTTPATLAAQVTSATPQADDGSEAIGEGAMHAAGGEEVAAAQRPHRRHRTKIGLVSIGALAVAAHLLLGGAALSAVRWTSRAADVVLAVVLVKLVALGVLAACRARASK